MMAAMASVATVAATVATVAMMMMLHTQKGSGPPPGDAIDPA